MRTLRTRWIWLLLAIIAILAACRQEQPAPAPDSATSAPALPTSVPKEQGSFSTQINNYNLGEVTILQDQYPEDSRFREMPVRLEGDRFTGNVVMRAVQIPLEAFAEIDLTNIDEINLLFDQSPSSALFVADLWLVKNDG